MIKGKIKGGIEVRVRWGKRRKQLPYDLKESGVLCKLKEDAIHRTLRKNRFGRGYRLIVRRTTEWMNEWISEAPNIELLKFLSNNIPTMTSLIPIYIHFFFFGFSLPDAFRCFLCTPSSAASTCLHFHGYRDRLLFPKSSWSTQFALHWVPRAWGWTRTSA